MSKVIPFKVPPTPEVLNMLEIGDLIDEAILTGLSKDMEALDLLGLLAHRMGTLLKVSNLDVENVLEFCNNTIKKKCGLESS